MKKRFARWLADAMIAVGSSIYNNRLAHWAIDVGWEEVEASPKRDAEILADNLEFVAEKLEARGSRTERNTAGRLRAHVRRIHEELHQELHDNPPSEKLP